MFNYLRNVPAKSFESFAHHFSDVLHQEHNIKLKPIKVLHAIAKVVGFRNWGEFKGKAVKRFPLYDQLIGCQPAGINRFIRGQGGTGKTLLVNGLVTSAIHGGYPGFNHSNVIILDIGGNYNCLMGMNQDVQLNVVTPTNSVYQFKNLTVFDLEPLGQSSLEVVDDLLSCLKRECLNDTLLIIDETWQMPASIIKWALTEFDGETLAIFQGHPSCSDIERMGATELFISGVDMQHAAIK
jgi:hypothetical protein